MLPRASKNELALSCSSETKTWMQSNLTKHGPSSPKILAMTSPKPHISSPKVIPKNPHLIAKSHPQKFISHRQKSSPKIHISSPNFIPKKTYLIAKSHPQKSTSSSPSPNFFVIANLHLSSFFVIPNLRCCHPQVSSQTFVIPDFFHPQPVMYQNNCFVAMFFCFLLPCVN